MRHYIVMAYIVMAYIVMACIVMAYIVCPSSQLPGETLCSDGIHSYGFGLARALGGSPSAMLRGYRDDNGGSFRR